VFVCVIQEHFDLNAVDIELNPINIENIERMKCLCVIQEHFDLNAVDIELNPINIENIELKDEDQIQHSSFIINDIEDVISDALIKKPLDKTR